MARSCVSILIKNRDPAHSSQFDGNDDAHTRTGRRHEEIQYHRDHRSEGEANARAPRRLCESSFISILRTSTCCCRRRRYAAIGHRRASSSGAMAAVGGQRRRAYDRCGQATCRPTRERPTVHGTHCAQNCRLETRGEPTTCSTISTGDSANHCKYQQNRPHEWRAADLCSAAANGTSPAWLAASFGHAEAPHKAYGWKHPDDCRAY